MNIQSTDEVLNIKKRTRHTRFFMVFLAIVILHSCAPVQIQPPLPPFTDREITEILSDIKDQEDAVHNFFSLGRIMLQGRGPDFEANALIIGTREPLKIKLEITHFWGRPLFHILITEARLHILSFPEKKYYLVDSGKALPSDLLPVQLDMDQLWAIGRGFPLLSRHNRAISKEENQICLLDRGEDMIQVIEFQTEEYLPHRIFFPEKGLSLWFSDYSNEKNIQYAKKTRLHDQAYETTLELNTKQVVFNKAIDSSIFELAVPPDFECIQEKRLLDTQ